MQPSQSKINGIGLFADQIISKGTLVQKFMPGFDQIIPEGEIQKLSEPAREQFLTYAYKTKDRKYILCFDNTRFLNHSDNPNLISNDPTDEIDIAARDIHKGEELTVNYKDFDADFDFKMSIH